MAPKVKVLETGNLGHGVTFEVRPASKGNPTVHVTVHGERLPAFRRKPTSSAEQQVRDLLKEHLPTHMEVEPEALQ